MIRIHLAPPNPPLEFDANKIAFNEQGQLVLVRESSVTAITGDKLAPVLVAVVNVNNVVVVETVE